MRIGTGLTNGRGISGVFANDFENLLVVDDSVNQSKAIKHRMNGCRHEKITGVSTVGAGSVSKRNISCGSAAGSTKHWVCWLILAGNRMIRFRTNISNVSLEP